MDLDEFQRRIVASGLVDEDDAASLRAHLSAPTIEAFGELLVAKQLVTPWQCARLLEGRYKGFFVDHYKLLEHLGNVGDRMRFLVENTHTHKHFILTGEQPKAGQSLVYDIDKIRRQARTDYRIALSLHYASCASRSDNHRTPPADISKTLRLDNSFHGVSPSSYSMISYVRPHFFQFMHVRYVWRLIPRYRRSLFQLA